jgi:phosphoribosylglycinamide formyltransferase-1
MAFKRERFVGETIIPAVDTADTSQMAAGGPGLPREFRWRGQAVRITAVLRTWRETGRCRHGSLERYVRKHWFEVMTSSNTTMKIYFDRQPRHGRKSSRWWLFSVGDSEGSPTTGGDP